MTGRKAAKTGPGIQQSDDTQLVHPLTWPATAVGAERDWYEFRMASQDPDDPTPTLYKVDLTFYMSNWSCIYGKCPSVMATGVTPEHGCCQLGVQFGDGYDPDDALENFNEVKVYVDQLTEADADNIDLIRENDGHGWYTKKVYGQRKGYKGRKLPYMTKVVDGACIMSNKPNGPVGKPGCALHHLAERLGVHHSETKPKICWSIPFAVLEEYDKDVDQYVVTLTSTHGQTWGHPDNGHIEGIGYWCVETPEAYQATSAMVYKNSEAELRLLIGDAPYEELVRRLDGLARRFPMPGESIAGGRPLIPLLVKRRVDMWAEEASKGGERASEAAAALDRSKEYLTTHGITPQQKG